MSDLFAPLREFEPPAEPLPSREVRRLGDRRRHRRHAVVGLAAAGVLGAVGAVATLGGVADLDAPAGPAQQPTPTETQSAPESRLYDFPLGLGLPASAQQLDLVGPANAPFPRAIPPVCGTDYELPGTPVDRASIEGTTPQYQGVRDVALYRSADQALGAIRSEVARLEACPREEAAGLVTRTTVRPLAGVGDRAWLGVRTYEVGGDVTGLVVHYLVHQGRAALVMNEDVSDPDAYPTATRDAFLADYRQSMVAPTAEALCDLHADLC